jgi:import inner membrane translocase subunit TIM23
MERRKDLGTGLIGLGLGSMPASDNIPVSSSVGSISPYMNFDPSYLNIGNEPQFIMPEGASQHRGRFELAFSQIGGSVCTGAGIGGAAGLYNGLRDTRQAQLFGAVRRTQLINSVAKKGASYAQSLGVIALMYSIFGVAVSKIRGADDELNTLGAATLTGLLYKIPLDAAKVTGARPGDHMKRMLRGGATGFALATVYCLYTSKDHLKQIVGLRD